MKRSLSLAAAILFCAEPAFAISGDVIPPREHSALEIEAGRLDVMMDQARDNTDHGQLVPVPGIAVEAELYKDGRAAVFLSLVNAVLDYNRIVWKVCGDAPSTSLHCPGGLYLPAWLNGKWSDFSDAQLQTMTDETSARLMPFWEATCALARGDHAAEPVCPME